MKEDYDGIKFPDRHQEYDRILVSLTSKDCLFKKSEHSSNHNFILIDSFFGSRLKCHDNEEPCKSGTEKIIKPEYLPECIKNIIGGKSVDESCNDTGSTNVFKSEETMKAIVKIPFKSDSSQPLLSEMKMAMGEVTQDLPNGYVVSLPLNTYCSLCQKHHEHPQNECHLYENGQKFITCKLKRGFYPNPPAQIPSQQLNIIFQSTIIQNNYVANVEQIVLPSDFVNDGIPIYQGDSSMQQLFFECLNGNHNPIAKYFYALNKDQLRCFGRNDHWFQFQGHTWNLIKSDIIRGLLCDSTFLKPIQETLKFYRQNPQLNDCSKKSKKIESLLQQLENDHF